MLPSQPPLEIPPSLAAPAFSSTMPTQKSGESLIRHSKQSIHVAVKLVGRTLDARRTYDVG